jgi:hypothetical protein
VNLEGRRAGRNSGSAASLCRSGFARALRARELFRMKQETRKLGTSLAAYFPAPCFIMGWRMRNHVRKNVSGKPATRTRAIRPLPFFVSLCGACPVATFARTWGRDPGRGAACPDLVGVVALCLCARILSLAIHQCGRSQRGTLNEFSPFPPVPLCATSPRCCFTDVVSHKGTKTQRVLDRGVVREWSGLPATFLRTWLLARLRSRPRKSGDLRHFVLAPRLAFAPQPRSCERGYACPRRMMKQEARKPRTRRRRFVSCLPASS